MLMGTIDFYHFTPLSVILTLAGGHKVSIFDFYHFTPFSVTLTLAGEGSRRQSLLALFSHTLCNWSG